MLPKDAMGIVAIPTAIVIWALRWQPHQRPDLSYCASLTVRGHATDRAQSADPSPAPHTTLAAVTGCGHTTSPKHLDAVVVEDLAEPIGRERRSR